MRAAFFMLETPLWVLVFKTDLSPEKRCRGGVCNFEKFLLYKRERERERFTSHLGIRRGNRALGINAAHG